MNIREILSKNLKENRQKLGITQAELAERAGISTNFVAMIELKHKFPTPETLDQLSTALDIDTYELFTTSASPDSILRKLHNDILADMKQFHQKVIHDLNITVDNAVEKALKKQK
ncbi:MAG: helix-turn-helix transcriptional regulator [Treponema sp.]|nr:helix-turn-helix transcriptional regulator [Treponema sp.]